MISPKFFFETLQNNGFDFFTGVPDSLLKDICAYITKNVDKTKHIIPANEGAAIALATGYNMSTGSYPLVYMQNSGIGNAINPLLSLADSKVYSIPMLILIGWRGEPGIKDEPQHIKQGEVTLDLLEAMSIPYSILIDNEIDSAKQVTDAVRYLKTNKSPYVLVVKKGTFESFKLESDILEIGQISREDAIAHCCSKLGDTDIVVSTTGMISRELYEIRERNCQSHSSDFLTVGSMGHSSQIALTISLSKENRNVYCFDGDGALIMHLGSLCIVGNLAPRNFVHIVFNNGAHDSVGGQPTVGFYIDIPKIAKACGYKQAFKVNGTVEFDAVFDNYKEGGPLLIEFIVKKGSRKDLGRPKTTPVENKDFFVDFLDKY